VSVLPHPTPKSESPTSTSTIQIPIDDNYSAIYEIWLSNGLIVVFSAKIAIKMAYIRATYSFCSTPVLHSYLPHLAGAACIKHVFIFTHNTIQQNSTPFFTECSVYLSYRHTKKYENLTAFFIVEKMRV
jgi:hypothetical protein